MSRFRVLIVGAGASGIAAGSRLLKCGINDIIILEAEERIGGRIHTCEFGEREVDMGAQWVHGENIIFELAKPHNLLEESISHYLETQFVSSKGELVSSHVSNQIMALIAQINESAMKDLAGFHGSLGEYFTNEFNKKLQHENEKGKLDVKLAKTFLDWYHKFENSLNASDSWFETSGKGHVEYWECEGNPMLNWKKGGYNNVFDILTGKYTDPTNELPVRSKIQLNKEVISIQWDGFIDAERKNKVLVNCADGSEYLADHVILTVSLGVLKEKLNMFYPELPMKKHNAIMGLFIGTVDKIFVRYSHRWWPQDCAGFSFVWNEDDKSAFKKDLIKNGMEGQEWLLDVFGFYSVYNHPLILCGWVVGPSAKIMEKLTNEKVSTSCNFLINFFLGRHYSIPQCEEIKKSGWYSNPHFRGSYSCRIMDTEKMGTSAEHLSYPLKNESGVPVLLFAGEATHPHYFSTVHGAVESGWREADYLIKSISHRNKGCGNCWMRNIAREFDVVIIGAGIAGLAAAKTLMNAGVKNIGILEAQNYAGGRILSIPFKESFLELGAQWIHGENNDVYKLAQNYNLISNISSVEGEGIYMLEDGTVIASELVQEVEEIVDKILEECESFAKEKRSLFHIPSSVGQHLKEKFKAYIDCCRLSGESEENISIKENLYDWHIRFQVIDNACMNLENLSAKAWGNYVICGGSEHVNLGNGYSKLIEKLLLEIEFRKTLHLNCPVKEVIWQPNIQASKHKCSGDDTTPLDDCIDKMPVRLIIEDGREFLSHHAIITCSLGYLKENQKDMFNPPLPKEIQGAIEDMGFATINKIFLDYGEPWWEASVQGFQLLWSKNVETSNSKNKDNWSRDISGFDVLPNHSGVLLGWVGSFGAEIVEDISEDEIGIQCTNILKKFTKRNDIPPPKRVIRSKWLSNRYVRGSYSHTTSICDSSGSSPSILSEPVYSKLSQVHVNNATMQPTILFAGEATHKSFFSTTHGAYESGKTQAEVLLSHMKFTLTNTL